jgi:AcrR family transcriptional regulator
MENRTRILEAYTAHLREHGTPPHTVHAFCKSLDLAERDFFHEFASLESVESAIWGDWISRLATSVSSGAEWKDFSARHRYLTFLFAFTESSLDWRSLMLTRFSHLAPVASPPFLKAFEEHFKTFAADIISHGISLARSPPEAPFKRSTPLFYTSTSVL